MNVGTYSFHNVFLRQDETTCGSFPICFESSTDVQGTWLPSINGHFGLFWPFKAIRQLDHMLQIWASGVSPKKTIKMKLIFISKQ